MKLPYHGEPAASSHAASGYFFVYFSRTLRITFMGSAAGCHRLGPERKLNFDKQNRAPRTVLAALAAAAVAALNVPAGRTPWMDFLQRETVAARSTFVFDTYLLPAFLAFTAIVLLQLQFRMAAGGSNKRIVFSVCLLASLATLVGFQRMSRSPSAVVPFALGMALGYTVASRIYAIRMKPIGSGFLIPWVVWRGNLAAVREIDRLAAEYRAMGTREASR